MRNDGVFGYDNNPIADGDYQIQIHTQDFAGMSPEVKAAGDVSLMGKLYYQNAMNEPLLHSVSIDGRLASEVFSAQSSTRHSRQPQAFGKVLAVGGMCEGCPIH